MSPVQAARRPAIDDWSFVNWFISRGHLSHNPSPRELRAFLRRKSWRRKL